MKEYLYVHDINDYEDDIITDDIVKFIPSIVQRQWISHNLYHSRKYYIKNRNNYNNSHSFFLERDYYKYEYEKTLFTIKIIRQHFIPTIGHYLKKQKKIGEHLKIIYNKMMNNLYAQLYVSKFNYSQNNY
jgi:hypothetical protein